MTQDTTILRQIYDYANRANPYPLWAQLRQTPVCWQEGGHVEEAGTYVVSTYRELMAVLHDPRLSSDPRNSSVRTSPGGLANPYQFQSLDPPEHDRLRALTMRHFGPPERTEYLEQLRPEILRIVTRLLDQVQGQRQFDLVESFAYPFPVTVICRILGVPPEDEPQFHVWVETLAESVSGAQTEAVRRQRDQAMSDLNQYMAELVEHRRNQPGDDLLSGMATDTDEEGRMADPYLVATASLLLFAGHETTVNLLANGMLTLVRHPVILERLRREPDLIPAAVEEMLRYEPPVHFIDNRTTLDEIELAGTTIPKGVAVTLALAAGNRDPARFPEPDRFDPERRDNAHLGFGSGIHSCFGAPLARMEAQIAFTELLQRLEQPRLVVDPPPYRSSPVLRGPEQLLIEVEGVR